MDGATWSNDCYSVCETSARAEIFSCSPWPCLPPPSAPTHSSTETLGALFLFLLTFNTTDTAETQNAYVTVGAGSVHLHRHVMSELTSSQTPQFLVSLSCVMSATRSACQLTAKERTEWTERQKWSETRERGCHGCCSPKGLSPHRRLQWGKPC